MYVCMYDKGCRLLRLGAAREESRPSRTLMVREQSEACEKTRGRRRIATRIFFRLFNWTVEESRSLLDGECENRDPQTSEKEARIDSIVGLRASTPFLKEGGKGA